MKQIVLWVTALIVVWVVVLGSALSTIGDTTLVQGLTVASIAAAIFIAFGVCVFGALFSIVKYKAPQR